MKTLNIATKPTSSFLSKAIAIIAALASTSGAALAQYSHTGDAYGARIALAAPVVGVGATATIVDNPNLPTGGSNSALTGGLASASADADIVGDLLDGIAVLRTGIISTSTVGPALSVTSFSQVNGLRLFPDVSILSSLLGSTTLVTADVVRSDTSANLDTNNGLSTVTTGTTTITNLRFGSSLQGTIPTVQPNILGNFSLLNNEKRTFYLGALGNVSENSNDVLDVVAELILNDQVLSNGGTTRTTNAVTVNVIGGASSLAKGQVIVASSTAGIVVPETGTLTYAISGGLLLAGPVMIRLRRRTKK